MGTKALVRICLATDLTPAGVADIELALAWLLELPGEVRSQAIENRSHAQHG